MKIRKQLLLLVSSVWFIAGAALTTRATFLWSQQHAIPHEVLSRVPFDQEAGNIALALAQGHGFSNVFRQNTGATAWLSPVYPFLLSLIFRLFGPFTYASFLAAAVLNVVFSAAATFPLYEIGQRIFAKRVGAGAAWLWVLLPSGILMPTEWIWDTSLSVLLAVTLLWLTLRVSESPKISLWTGYSLLWALALLTNPSLGIVFPFLLVWATTSGISGSKVPWKLPCLALAIVVLCCLPWTARNYAQFHRLMPLRSNFAFELWIGNNDVFDVHAIGGRQRITRFEETRRYAELGETAYLDEKWNLARTFILQKPSLFLRLTERKFVATWTGTEHPLRDFGQTDSVLARVVIAFNLLLILGLVGGTWRLARSSSPFTFPLAIFPVLYPLVYYVTHTSLRYRHPIDPLLALLAAAALDWILGGKASAPAA